MTKNRGGRGRKAESKYETVTISLPPELKKALDAAVSAEISRSEVVAQLIAAHLVQSPQKKKPKQVTAEIAQKLSPKPSVTNLPGAVTVISQHVPRGLKWKPEKYAIAERLLQDGYTIRKNSESADYTTEKGGTVSWRTVQALLKLGILVPVT